MEFPTNTMIKQNKKRYRLFKLNGPVQFGDACKLCDFNENGTNDCLDTGVCCQAPFGYYKEDERFKF